MNRPRPLPFRTLAVHRPTAAEQPAAPARARSGFSEMLRRGGNAAAASAPPAPQAGLAGTLPAMPFADDGDGDGAPRDDDSQPEGDDAGLVGELVPSIESLASLLTQASAPTRELRDRERDAIRSLSTTIAGFCNERAVSDSEGWNVRIELRPDVLANTTLDLAVSAHWLQLRFQAGNAASRRLLSEHEATLRRQLADALDRSREIAITID